MGPRGAATLRPLVFFLLASGVAGAPAQAQLRTQPYLSGLSFPVGFIPDPTAPGRFFVVEQMGQIRIADQGVLLADPFLDVTALVTPRTPIEAERGLLGMVLAPDYASSGRFFVAFTREGSSPAERGDLVIARYTRASGDPLRADPGSRFDLRWGGPAGPAYIEHSARPSHNGGSMAFGADGYLYIGLGDGGGNGDPDNNAQNPMELKGKILRIDVGVPDSDPQGYRIPADNPFLDNDPIAALPEIWAFGVRNPWRITFDDPALGGTGALLIADVGQDRWEEVTYEPAGLGGRNYGWRVLEGTNPYYNTDVPDYVAPAPAFLPLTDPAFEYFHSAGVSVVEGYSLTGGYVYRGSGLGEAMRGRYFFADFALAKLWSARVTPDASSTSAAFSDIIDHTSEMSPGRLSSLAVDLAGELYLVRYGAVNQGAITRVCGVALDPKITSFSVSGGIGTIHVTAPPGCTWTVSSDAPWLSVVSDTSAVGSRTIVFRVAANAEGTREGGVTVGGQRVAIAQSTAPPVPGDVDNNGSVDLFWQHADGRLALWMMNGTTLVQSRAFGPGSIADPAWRIAAAGDFDRDGSTDVIFQHQTDGRLAVWYMSGGVLLSAEPLSPGSVPDTAWKIRAATDLNGDGWTDLLWQHQTTGAIGVWLMAGTQLRDAHLLTPGSVADLDWRIVGAGDLNGDGNVDLVWQHQTSGLIGVWFMRASALQSAVLLTPGQVADTDWKIRAVVDLNGDGRPDLVWQNQATGMLSTWLLDGIRLADGLQLTPAFVDDTNWQVVGPK
jgi:glucose/arabinose dehydrogenase